MRANCAAWRVCLYLARYPDRSLTTRDIADKWHYTAMSELPVNLRPAVDQGWLVCERGRGRGKFNTYRAGARIVGMQP